MTAATRWARTLAALGVAAAGALVLPSLIGALSHCSPGAPAGPEAGEADEIGLLVPDPTYDAASPLLDAASPAFDGGAGYPGLYYSCDGGTDDAAVWPGWQPQNAVTALSACCPWAVPSNVTGAMAPWAWVPCSNGAPGCLEFAASWVTPPTSPIFGSGKASRGADGSPRWLMFNRGTASTDSADETDLYDMTTGTPIAAWRDDDAWTQHPCLIEPLLGQQTVTINGLFPQGSYLATGSPQEMMAAPSLQSYLSEPVALQERLASDRVFAFDVEPEGIIARTELGSGVLRQAKGKVGLLLAMVEGDDVFAISEHGDAGWGQIYTVDASGSLALLRSNASAHVATPASDGSRIYWTETYGSTDGLADQTRTEFWSAPYTADAATLSSTATKIAEIPNRMIPITAVAFSGVMAVATRDNSVYVVRASDGKVIQPDPGPNRYFSGLIAVTPTELWTIESGNQGPPNAYLARIGLGTW